MEEEKERERIRVWHVLCMGSSYSFRNCHSRTSTIRLQGVVDLKPQHTYEGKGPEMTMSLIDPEYMQGLEDGYIDGCVISQPCNEGEHSLERYQTVSYKYKSCISPFLIQTQYTLGYGNGVDAAKYVLRSASKNGIVDLKKALWYLQREIQQVESK